MIGYYVHHQGKGHLARALAVTKMLPSGFTLLGTGVAGQTGDAGYLELPPDLPISAAQSEDYDCKPTSLHYAPLRHFGIRERMGRLAAWVCQAKPALMVVDVSVEVAMLARLMATPVIYVRLNGNRNDAPHMEAFRGATAILAPFHAALEDPETPDWAIRKTIYISGITSVTRTNPPVENIVLVVNGAGGAPLNGDEVACAARAMPALRWRSIGAVTPPVRDAPNLTRLGWVANADTEICNAMIVIGGAGDGLVNATLALRSRFICMPQNRPFGEQHAKARRLAALGAAVVIESWPDASCWPALIARAMALDPARQAALHDPDGASAALKLIQSYAS